MECFSLLLLFGSWEDYATSRKERRYDWRQKRAIGTMLKLVLVSVCMIMARLTGDERCLRNQNQAEDYQAKPGRMFAAGGP